MRLFEHPDFEQAVLQAQDHFRDRKLRAAIIEKNYYVTEALRITTLTALLHSLRTLPRDPIAIRR